MRARRPWTLMPCLLAALWPAGDVRAQAPTSAGASPTTCTRPAPRARCSSFWVSELGLAGGWATDGDRVSTGTVEVGRMWNYHEAAAVGFGVRLGWVEEGGLFSVKFRFRHWLEEGRSVDLGFGLGGFEYRGGGAGGTVWEVGYNVGERWGVVSEAYIGPGSGGRDAEWAWMLGPRLSSSSGLRAVGIVGTAAFLVHFLSFGNDVGG